MKALYSFLENHSTTLRSLKLPSYIPDVPFSNRPLLSLRELDVDVALAPQMISFDGGDSVSGIEVLSINCWALVYLPSNTPFGGQEPVDLTTLGRCPCPRVRSLTLVLAVAKFKFEVIPMLFPHLEELHIDLTESVRCWSLHFLFSNSLDDIVTSS